MMTPDAKPAALDAAVSLARFRNLVVGIDAEVPVLDGRRVRYVNLDNAASTPALRPVLEAVNRFMPWYSSIHRGTGFKSWLSSSLYDEAHDLVAAFVGADPRTHTVLFGKNATEAINKASYRLGLRAEDVVLTTLMEHHSNDLPWRGKARTVHLPVLDDGRLDMEAAAKTLAAFAGRVRLLAVTGASNITGIVNPLRDLARLAHAHGAMIFVDAAQLAPHRAIRMGAADDPARFDFVVLSAHKMYAPFGTGALIGPKDVFQRGDPEYVGGGTVDIVGTESAYWTHLPDREEAGTPNVVGAVALAKAIRVLEEVGMEAVATHEAELTAHLLRGLRSMDRVEILGPDDPDRAGERLGVVAFNVAGMPHGLVAAILSCEAGIGVRNGCFCAHPYLKRLLGTPEAEAARLEEMIRQGDRSELPGAVRVSFGLYNTLDEVDVLLGALSRVVTGAHHGTYRLDRRTGSYHAEGFDVRLRDYFEL
jgi:selenocysteine lyase/cysteine desulfurase